MSYSNIFTIIDHLIYVYYFSKYIFTLLISLFLLFCFSVCSFQTLESEESSSSSSSSSSTSFSTSSASSVPSSATDKKDGVTTVGFGFNTTSSSTSTSSTLPATTFSFQGSATTSTGAVMQIKKKVKTNNLIPIATSLTGPVPNANPAIPVSLAVTPVIVSTGTDVTAVSHDSVVGQKRNIESNA